MDQPGLCPDQHHHALSGLARINWISASDAILWRALRRFAEQQQCPLRVLDIATGGGDIPIRLFQRAHRAGLALHLAGADISPTAIRYAQEQARRQDAAVEFFALDVLRETLPTDYDVIVTSLFLHHLPTESASDLLARMASAARGMVLVNDLIRSPLGYLVARAGTRISTSSPVVHVDGPRSVAAAFTMPEALALAEQAGLHGATIAWRWPFRFLLTWRRPP